METCPYTQKTLNTHLYKVFFFQRNKYAVANDDVVQNFYANLISRFDKLFRGANIFLGRLRIATGVVVAKDNRVRACFNRKAKDFAWVENTSIQRAFKRCFCAFDTIGFSPSQIVRAFSAFPGGCNSAFRIEAKNTNDFLLKIPHFRHKQVCNVRRRCDFGTLCVRPC